MAGHTHYPNFHSNHALPQVPPISYEETDFWPKDLFAWTHDLQVSEETYPTASGLDSSLQSAFVRGHNKGGISHTDNISLPSTLLGFEGFRATSDEIATSNLVERRARSKSNQSRRTRNKRVESPLRSPRQSAVMREVLERPYLCKACGERYAQPQGVNRHYRAKHDPSSCNYCGANWSRPYQYRDHIEKRHPDIDPDLVLGKVAGSRRKATVIGREQPPAIIHGQQIHHISMRPTPTLPAPAAVKATRVPSSLFSNGKEAQPVSVLPPVRQAPDRSSRAATALFPTPLPAGGFYGASSVSFDPIIESSGVILYPSQFSVANYGGVWTNAFKPRV